MEDLRKLVNAAYQAAYERDLAAAEEHLVAICRLGGRPLQRAMLAWVDRTISVLGVRRGTTPGFVLEMDGTGDQVDVDQVRPEVAWAGRLFAARLARDAATWQALLTAMPRHEADGAVRYLMALLTVMTTTAASAAENTPEASCCVLHRIASSDPITAAARRAVAHLN